MQGPFRIFRSRLKASAYVFVRSDQHGPSFPDAIDGFELVTNKMNHVSHAIPQREFRPRRSVPTDD
jgi:hypothetical protein